MTPINVTDHQMFADEFTSILYTNPNECSSALGVSMAFSLIYPGSTGDGLEEIRDTLYYPEGSNMRLVWEKTTQSMLGSANGEDQGWAVKPLLKIANSVWFDDGDTLDPDYKSVVSDYAKQIDLAAADSPIIVNEWVDESTNGMITEIVPEDEPLFPPYVLVAINSIYLKAAWREQFKEAKTNLDSFYESATSTNEVSQAHFMNMVDRFQYSHDALPGYQVIDLPFDQSQMSMIFVLPMADDMETISSTDLIAALTDLKSTRVALSLPKFKFESKYEATLKDSLRQMGMTAPFTEGAGALCGLFDNYQNCKDIFIDKVIQKTVIDVNEEGVEAAAVTAVGVGVTSVPSDEPVLVTLDHPFQFFIYDNAQGLALFEGRVGKPEVPEGMPKVPLLDSKRTDDDFWSKVYYGVTPMPPPAFVAAVTGVGGGLTETQPTVVASGSSDVTQPTEAAGTVVTTHPTEAAGAEEEGTTQPTEAAPSDADDISSGNKFTGSSDVTQPTEAAGTVVTTQPTEAAGAEEEGTTQPTEAAPSDADDISSGNKFTKRSFSICMSLFLACALGFVH
eukprot:CAMPEP_0196191778 /NCGR_PEP_ID=MMETSP0911-20130528/48669_1 /TAXON_ID=49265 /ORGANISM="Thalassiosira rotula, Strain GSO102" /LENGTH=562 /DNA_ID=CAMNT_0041463931 /DNA_START=547 /DNA_END=2235 /DNA_ORIENTATION=-